MGPRSLKVSCVLEGDSAMDFEHLHKALQIEDYAQGRSKQQTVLVTVALLITEAVMRRCGEQAGTRYPELAAVMHAAGCSQADIATLQGQKEAPVTPTDAIKTAILRSRKP